MLDWKRTDNAINKQYDNCENTALEIRALPLPGSHITHSYMMRANAYMNMHTTTHMHIYRHTSSAPSSASTLKTTSAWFHTRIWPTSGFKVEKKAWKYFLSQETTSTFLAGLSRHRQNGDSLIWCMVIQSHLLSRAERKVMRKNDNALFYNALITTK